MAVTIAREVKARGVRRYGMQAVWEVMRFRYLETTGDVFKLNNNYCAVYARWIMARESGLAGFFETRTRRP